MSDKNENKATGSTPEGRNLAWRRFSARWIDWVLGVAVGHGIFRLMCMCKMSTEGALFSVICLICYFYFDVVEYLVFGNTLGKRIFAIRICRNSGDEVGRLVYLWRALAMTWFGLKFLLWPIVCIHQYVRVSHGREASYDLHLGYKAVSTRSKKWYDSLIPIALILIPLAGIFLGALLPALHSVLSK